MTIPTRMRPRAVMAMVMTGPVMMFAGTKNRRMTMGQILRISWNEGPSMAPTLMKRRSMTQLCQVRRLICASRLKIFTSVSWRLSEALMEN